MQTVPHCPAKWTFFHVLAHYAMCCTSWALSGLFMFYIFGYLWRNPPPPPPWNLSMLTFYTCKCMYRRRRRWSVFWQFRLFFFYKTALKLSESEEKVNAMVIRGFFFFAITYTYWIGYTLGLNPKTNCNLEKSRTVYTRKTKVNFFLHFSKQSRAQGLKFFFQKYWICG